MASYLDRSFSARQPRTSAVNIEPSGARAIWWGSKWGPLAFLRAPETAQDSALRVDLQDAPGYRVAHIKDVFRRDHKAKGMPQAPLPQKPAIPVEDLNACILTVAYVDEVTIDHDRMRSVELSRPSALHSPTKQRAAELVEL